MHGQLPSTTLSSMEKEGAERRHMEASATGFARERYITQYRIDTVSIPVSMLCKSI